MPLTCTPEIAAALQSMDALRALHEGPDGPIDLGQRYSTVGPSPDPEDRDNPTLFFKASQFADEAMVRYIAAHLIEEGRNLHVPNASGATPIWIAAQYGRDSNIRALCELGGDPNQAASGLTPCWIAAAKGREACIRALYQCGADTGRSNLYGQTPLRSQEQLHSSASR